ncbi:hypothetical protein H4R19_007330, partial [Coemansia spiralis]
MAFINKILQKTKNKIGDRDRDSPSSSASSGSQTIDRVGPPTLCSPADPPVQKHVVPSHAPVPLTLTGMATRAASFSVGAHSAAKGGAYGVYPGAGVGV